MNDAAMMDVNTISNLQYDPRKTQTTLNVPLDLTENNGIIVRDAVSRFFKDPEGGTLGACIIMADTSGEGFYSYPRHHHFSQCVIPFVSLVFRLW